ncbi:MAG: hypothetical protein DHS20C18_15830 [Saprospiraceae bacterium]|nr:MAG: hypothetical protein DHS20C18_15830 [Saprospiraceae bacterium]
MRLDYLLAEPFPHLIIDDFCETDKLEALLAEMPDINTKSRDYVFAANKFEKSKFWQLSPRFETLYQDLISDTFQDFLRFITNEAVFMDNKFHGGGIHQGKEGSFLDMHLDFNYHPLHKFWYRNLNILLYLNKGWQPEHGGHLKLKDLRTGAYKEIGVPFNRLVIQQTRNYTLHGYDHIRFPSGSFRTSIAGYAYSQHQYHIEKPRTTDWFVPSNQPVKKLLARIYDPAVKLKNAFFGSATAKN